ncbi:WD40 repeat domain-containing protein [Streptomyces noursei]|uniref:WD40 repeat domain-containing protein n=1 Tax=Streptomyces noursei TaxID=1971 RepID=UPI0036D2A66D
MSYRKLWEAGPRRDEVAVIDSGAEAVGAVCALPSAEGMRVAAASSDGRIQVWDPLTGQRCLVFGEERAAVFALCAVSVGGETFLASGGADATVHLWDPRTGASVRTLPGHEGRLVHGLCAVPFGGRELVASGGDDGTVRLWDPATGRPHLALDAGTEPYDGTHPRRGLCAFELDGRDILATGGDDGTVRLWDVATGGLIRQFNGEPDRNRGTTCVRYRSDYVYVEPTGHTGPVYSLCAFRSGERTVVASGAADRKVRLWDAATGELLHKLDCASQSFGVCAVQVAGRTLVATVGGGNDDLRLWDAESGELLHTLQGHTGPVWGGVCALPRPEGPLLASGGGKFDGTVRLWDPAARPGSGPGLRELSDTLCTVPARDRMLVASGSHNGAVRLWDAEDGTRTDVIDCKDGKFNGNWVGDVCALPAEGRTLLAVASHNRTIRLHDPAAGEEVRLIGHYWDPADPERPGVGTSPLTAEGRPATGEFTAACTVPADGRYLLATCGQQSSGATTWELLASRPVTYVRLWDPDSGEHVRTVGEHEGRLDTMCALPLPDRTLLACAGQNSTIRLWDVAAAPSRPRELHTTHGRVNALCAVPVEGRTVLASAGHDGTVGLLDPESDVPVRTLRGHREWVEALCVLPVGDRTLLASGSKDRTVRLWDVDAFACVAEIPVHAPVTALAASRERLYVATYAGMIGLAVEG